MAERRMFAKTIIDSDAFLDMPLSAQSLYFHLSMRADDEGFINNPKKIQRMIGASDDDGKLLIAKNFIIPFESGVVVIKHWKIHNYIRNDRLNQTKYVEERNQLAVKENGAYTLREDLKEIEAIEQMDAKDKRKLAYKNSSLPYSFTYKIKRAFEGHRCPVCGIMMTSSLKNAMPTVQHNTPISKGGVHELENISVICESCNTSIRDKETSELNNAEVAEMWERIVEAEKNNIKWFWNPEILDGQMSDICQTNDRQMTAQGRLGKDSIGKDSVVEALPPTTTDQIEIIIREWNAQDITRNIDRIPFGKARYNSTMMCIGTDFDGFIHTIQTLKEQEFLTQWAKEKPIVYDWFLENYQKVVEGNYSKVYEKKPEGEKKTTEFQNFSQRNYDWKSLEGELLAK